MTKSPEAFRTISEAAEELDLPQHVLRFWETKFPQIKPLKRGGGRRYYRPEDLSFLKGVKYYLYDEGYTIKGLQKLIKERGVRFVSEGNDTDEAGESISPQLVEYEKRSDLAPVSKPQKTEVLPASVADQLKKSLSLLEEARNLLNYKITVE